MDNQISPIALNAAKAIRDEESGGNYTARGPSGEFGGYQFTPDTWAAVAPKYGVNVPLEQADRVTQNKVAVNRINDWIKTGQAKNIGEVASMWNAGEGAPQAYLQNHRGVNNYGVQYDTPAYAERVARRYQQIKAQSGSINTPSSTHGGENIEPGAVQAQKDLLKAQGEPVSTQDNRVEPTFFGSVLRGLLKTPAKVATSLVQAGEVATGNKVTEPFSGGYLGRVEPLGGGLEGTTGRMIKEGVGAGLEAGSYLIGGGEAKAGMEAAQQGIKFTKPLISQIGKGVAEGAATGVLGGTGQALAQGQDVSEAVKTGAVGGLLGGLTGGVLGTAGGLLSKKAGITAATENQVKNALEKDYTESLASTVSGRKVLSENAEGLKASLEAGVLPNVQDGRYDVTDASAKLQEMMDKLGQARGADIAAQNKPVDVMALKQSILDNVNQFTHDPSQKASVTRFVDKWFQDLGAGVDLAKLNRIQPETGKLARFESGSDAATRAAYRNIYHGIGNYINDAVKGSGGVNQDVNKTLTKYHRIQDFLEALHGKKVKDSGLVSILSSHAAQTTGTALGATFGGAGGAVIGSEVVPRVASLVKKIFGKDTAGYSKVMESIMSGEQDKIAAVLKQVEKNKGSQAARDIERMLQETPQLPAPKPGSPKSQNFVPIEMGGKSEIEAPAQKITRHNTAKSAALKKRIP